jgi:hypothetical protein
MHNHGWYVADVTNATEGCLQAWRTVKGWGGTLEKVRWRRAVVVSWSAFSPLSCIKPPLHVCGGQLSPLTYN